MKQKVWLTLITCLAYCVDRELWKAIDYLKEQVRVLQEQQEEDKRILLNGCQRIRLAARAKQLTRRLLEETTVLFTPDTILGWYRKLIAQKYDGSKNCKNPGRPRMSQEITDLMIRFKQENPHWGGERKVKAGTCRVRLEPTLLPFKSTARQLYVPETSHQTWTEFQGQDQRRLAP
jgi:hypothetical protein